MTINITDYSHFSVQLSFFNAFPINFKVTPSLQKRARLKRALIYLVYTYLANQPPSTASVYPLI